MLKIYLIRHGQTEFNVQERVQGWNDSPLTALGLYQPKCTGYGLKDVVFTKAYSGDCLRQIETAKQVLAQNNHPVEIIPDYHFREMCYGKYQGGPYFDMLNPLYEMHNATYNGYNGLYQYMNDYEIATEVCKKDETGATEGPIKAYKRFKEGLDMIIKNNPEGNILLSTSSAVISFVLTNLFPTLKQDGLVDNASISIIKYENNEFILEAYNDISYRKLGEKIYKL